MRTALLACAALVGFAAPGCAWRNQESRASSEAEKGPKQLRPGQIIVALAADREEELARIRRELAADYDLVEVGNFLLGSIQLECVVFQPGSDQPLPDLLERLRRDRRVRLAEPNQVFREQGAGGPTGNLSYGAVLIHADAAHRSRTGKGIKVALIDTGVSTTHPALRGRIVETQNFVEGGDASFARDLHGTAVAGVIAAQRDDQVGLLGIAPDAEILALKACWYAAGGGGKAICSSWTLAKAVDFAIGAQAQVLNMSLSGPPDELLGRLIERAQQRGFIVVAAAAEGADAPGFPASMASVIAVVASDARGQARLPTWAARTFAIVAPGVDILTTVPAAGYDFLSGSSFAAAHVSGVVALLREGNPRLAGHEALDLLKATAHPLPGAGSDVATGAGLVDACAALGRLLGTASCP